MLLLMVLLQPKKLGSIANNLGKYLAHDHAQRGDMI